MRAHRIALFLGWLLVSSLAVAGFATFTADDNIPEELEHPAGCRGVPRYRSQRRVGGRDDVRSIG